MHGCKQRKRGTNITFLKEDGRKPVVQVQAIESGAGNRLCQERHKSGDGGGVRYVVSKPRVAAQYTAGGVGVGAAAVCHGAGKCHAQTLQVRPVTALMIVRARLARVVAHAMAGGTADSDWH